MKRPDRKKAKRIIAISALILFVPVGCLAFAGVYLRYRPESLLTNRTGRAVAKRLMRIESVRSYVRNRADTFITPRTVSAAWEHMNIEEKYSIDDFRNDLTREKERFNSDALSPPEKRENFIKLLKPDAQLGIPILMGIPEEYRREAVKAVAETLKIYRQNMTYEEEKELRRYFNSPEGRNLLHDWQRRSLNTATPDEIRATAPVVNEIVEIVTSVLE